MTNNNSQKKILAIDDNVVNLSLLKHIINLHYPDFQFLQTLYGKEGIELARKENPDLILLDIIMPEINGYEVCKILKSDISTKDIPVIMVSALGKESSERIKGLDVGADAFISKPFQQDELRAMIDVAIRIKKTENILKENVLQIKKYQKKLQELNKEIVSIEEKERRRIAENLHDGLGQTLSLAYMKLSSIHSEQNINDIFSISDETLNLLNIAISESRTLTYDLCPPIIYELGLIAAIKWKMQQIKEKHNLRMLIIGEDLKIEVHKDYNIFLYRMVSELFANIIKHAKADLVELEVYKENGSYIFIVRDNGVGFHQNTNNATTTSGGFGLMSITERIDSINGSFDIKSEPGKGTEAKITILSLDKEKLIDKNEVL